VVSLELIEAEKVIETLTGVASMPSPREMTRKEKREQAARIRRFLTLPPQLQEGVLLYGENIRKAYLRQT